MRPLAAQLRLYLVTDPAMTARHGLLETVAAAVRGGVTAVQLRDKDASTRDLVEAARALLGLLRPLGVPLLVNDDVEAAAVAGADGVHVGQADLAPRAARERLGAGAMVGLSVTCAAEVGTIDREVVDYVGLGPIFPTGAKPDATPALGEAEFAAVRARIAPLLVVAIGGIGPGTAARALRAGADGVAVVSAICAATDPQAAARAIAEELELAARSRA